MPMVKLPLALEHALLGFLRGQPMHGYEMHQRLLSTEELGLVWQLKQSQLYALLTKLEGEGYVCATTESQGSRPPRRVLHLTPAGEAAFERWMVTPVEHGRDFRLEFLAKLYFAHQESPDTVAYLVARQREACDALLEELHAQAAVFADENSYNWLVTQFRIGQLEATLTWLDTCHQKLALA